MSNTGLYYCVAESEEWRGVGRASIPFTPVTPPPPSGSRPSRATTGLVGAGNPSLTSMTAGTYSASGLLIENRSINGDITFTGSNITIRNCSVTGQIKFRSGSNYVAEYCDVHGIIFDGSQTGRASYIYTTGAVGVDGVQVKADIGTTPTNITIEHSYLGNPVINASSHYDTIQVRGVNGLTISGNYFNHGNTFSDRYNATVFLENANGGNYNVTIDGNWSNARGYYHYRLFGYSMTVQNNTFENKGAAGPLIGSSYPISTSINNLWDDGSVAIPNT